MSLDIKKLKSKYKTRYRFRGNDFNELAEKWGIEIPDDLSLSDHKPIEEFLCSLLNDFLRHFNYEDTPDEEISKYLRMVANDIRKYLRKLIDRGRWDHYRQVWKEVVNIQDDYSLISFTMVTVGLMWV